MDLMNSAKSAVESPGTRASLASDAGMRGDLGVRVAAGDLGVEDVAEACVLRGDMTPEGLEDVAGMERGVGFCPLSEEVGPTPIKRCELDADLASAGNEDVRGNPELSGAREDYLEVSI